MPKRVQKRAPKTPINSLWLKGWTTEPKLMGLETQDSTGPWGEIRSRENHRVVEIEVDIAEIIVIGTCQPCK